MELRTVVQSSLGKISFTSDMWTSPSQVAFMAVTAHYILRVDGHLEIRSRLIAFRKISGDHSGHNMAQYMAKILHELHVIEKVSSIKLPQLPVINDIHLLATAWTVHIGQCIE
jgi:hypothetical protein